MVDNNRNGFDEFQAGRDCRNGRWDERRSVQKDSVDIELVGNQGL